MRSKELVALMQEFYFLLIFTKVVTEHERSKCHREAEAAEKSRVSVAKSGGFFRRQMDRRDDATITAMRTLLWLVKENVAVAKWESLKGMSLCH